MNKIIPDLEIDPLKYLFRNMCDRDSLEGVR